MNEFLERISKLSPKRLALLAMDLQKRLEQIESRVDEPIAVIGLGCRFPGGASGPEAYWRLLRNGVDAVSEVPSSRWDAAAVYDSNADAPGRTVSKWGSFLDNIDQFDARFFGISRREAVSLDPQQRLLLEVSWEALEHAGVAPDSIASSATGVFVTIGGQDYYHLLLSGGSQTLDAYSVSGNAPSMAAGRLAYFLGLHGPALTVDTACSSSLVAVHLACQSLRAGECRAALTGGANLLLSPETSIGLSQAHMLSPTGRCRTFDAKADGIVRGEGCGILVLKRLSDAYADGDRVLAVLRGTAINQDGRSSGITAPNGPAQEAVIREALRRSGLSPADIDYLEAHGTGTPLGDPIEVRALANVFGSNPDRQLLVGSVKTNFGHLEMAAGIAGLMKVVLALQHDEIPPHLHVDEPSGYIDWATAPIEIAKTLRPWHRGDRVRRAGVSCFGFSGTNAHLIVEEAPLQPVEAEQAGQMQVLALSARSEHALAQLAERHRQNLNEITDAVADVCFSSNVGRTHFSFRAVVTGGTREEMIDALANFGKPDSAVIRGRIPESGRAPDVAFLFTGQGSQYVGMGRELFETQPVFRQALEECDQRLAAYLGRSICALIHPPPGMEVEAEKLLALTTYTQPALFALEYALTQLWRSWGVTPSVVAGHSVGEYVAACVAGVLTLDDALRLIVTRGRLMGMLPAGGAMASVFCDEETANDVIGSHANAISVAAVNGPAHVVISGPSAAVDQVLGRMASVGIRFARLNVSHAFHSTLLDPMLDQFEAEAASVAVSPAELTLVSNLTGAVIPPAQRMDGRYWRDHARKTVRFADAVRSVCAQGCGVVVEIGPHPVLLGMARECVADSGIKWIPSLRRGASDNHQMLMSVAALYAAGVKIDWHGFYKGQPRRKVTAPTYPFQRESYWLAHAPQSNVKPELWRDWLYSEQWRPVSGSADYRRMAMPRTLEARELKALCEEHGATSYESLYPALDLLCSAYARQALEKLGWSVMAEPRFTADELRRRLGVKDTHERLFLRLLEILAEDGFLTRNGDLWEVQTVPPAIDPGSVGAKFLADLPNCRAELTTTMACGSRLAEVLTGRCDPLELLFPGGSLEVAEDLYVRAPSMRVFNAMVAGTVVEAMCGRKGVRILEIGAGTGATAASVLPQLTADARYLFTDVSSAFTARARLKFAQYRNVEYRTLDIERDPSAQGFGSQRFDIVIASNVLHATARLDETLSHVRSLLEPDGLLILVEATGRQRFGDLTVGLTPGWWKFADTDVRSDYALLTAEQWNAALERSGFCDVVARPEQGLFSAGVFANMTLLTARSGRPAAVDSAKNRNRIWVVFADRRGIAERLASEIRERGEDCAVIDADVHLCVPEDLRAPGIERLVVNCRPLDANHDENADSAQVMAAVEEACGSTLRLAQSLASGRSSTRLFVLTQGAQELDPIRLASAAAQASVQGLCRTISLELPELRCTSADLPTPLVSGDISALFELLASESDSEHELALRDGTGFARRIVRSASVPAAGGSISLRSQATYLITGGLSGLGLRLAEWLVDRGARHLVLAGRSGAGASARATIEQLRRRGAKVTEMSADVSRKIDVDQMFAAVEPDAPLAGVFHLAGSVDDGVILQQNWARFDRVMGAKARGSWMLHQRTASMALDYFVLFSTGASFLGSAGQSNHAAANAYMDALARLRRARGLPGLSINWGAWSEIGAATKGDVANRARSRGLGIMSPQDALAAMEHALRTVSGQVGILPIDWATFLSERPDDAALADFRRMSSVPAPQGLSSDPQPAAEELPTAWLNDVAPGRLRPALERVILREVTRVLGLRESEVDAAQPLWDAGMDSLMAVELRNSLSRLTGITLPAAILFNYPAVEDLLAHLNELLGGGETAAEGESKPDRGIDTSELDELSEDELATLLAGKLGAGASSTKRGVTS